MISARACGRLAFHWGVRPVPPKDLVIILDGAPTAAPLERALNGAGVRTARVDLGARDGRRGARDEAGARARRRARRTGPPEELDGALVAVATLPSPASELPRQHGAAVTFEAARGGFAAIVDAQGATTVPDVFACGDVTGYAGPEAAARAGAKVGRALAATLALLVALAVVPSGCATLPAPPPAAAVGGRRPRRPCHRASSSRPLRRPGTGHAGQRRRGAHQAAAIRSSTPPGRRCATSTTTRRWAASTGTRSAPSTSRWRWGRPSEAAFYRLLNQMIGELGQSHMMITGPGAEDELAADETAKPGDAPADAPGDAPAGPFGGPIGDRVSPCGSSKGARPSPRVRAGSSAEKAGLAPGDVVTQVSGRPLEAPHNSTRPLRPVEERFELRRAAALRLAGPVGTRVTVSYLDERDHPGKAVLVRDPPRGQAVQIGFLPPIYPEVRAYEIGDVGVIAFSIFFLDPVLGDIKKAVARFQEHHVRAIVLDVRGNPGGQGAMSIPVASLFVNAPVQLGTLTFRDMGQKFEARPELGSTPFLGPLAILTDEGTASTSEMFAAGLQEAKRAVVVGDTTLGAVLPSVVQLLPGGAVMQYVVADFKTPKGVLLEGRGVQPDRRVVETRAAFRAGAIRSLTPPSSPSEHRAHDDPRRDLPRSLSRRLPLVGRAGRAGRRVRGPAAAGAGHRAGGAQRGVGGSWHAHARRHPGRRGRGDRGRRRLGAAHKTAHIKLTVSLQGMGMGGPAEHFQTNANRSLTLTMLPGVRAIREGSNGKVMWAQESNQRHQGPRRGRGRAGAHRGRLEPRLASARAVPQNPDRRRFAGGARVPGDDPQGRAAESATATTPARTFKFHRRECVQLPRETCLFTPP